MNRAHFIFNAMNFLCATIIFRYMLQLNSIDWLFKIIEAVLLIALELFGEWLGSGCGLLRRSGEWCKRNAIANSFGSWIIWRWYFIPRTIEVFTRFGWFKMNLVRHYCCEKVVFGAGENAGEHPQKPGGSHMPSLQIIWLCKCCSLKTLKMET